MASQASRPNQQLQPTNQPTNQPTQLSISVIVPAPNKTNSHQPEPPYSQERHPKKAYQYAEFINNSNAGTVKKGWEEIP